MIKAVVLDRKKGTVGLLLVATFIAAVLWYAKDDEAAVATSATTTTSKSVTASQAASQRTFKLVTQEFKTTAANGKTTEVYQWDPDTIYVKKGDTVKLTLQGTSNTTHPFEIEGLGIKGEVKKGKEETIEFKADKAGTYRLICHTHEDYSHNGPMIGYIVVQ